MCDQELAAHFEALKLRADQHWLIDPQRSLEIAEQIIQEARQHNCPEYIALGTMACADALKLLGELEHAWSLFDEAGRLYLAIGNEFGWARTRIGRLAICFEVGQSEVAFRDVPRAREIFSEANDFDRNRRLYQNAAIAYQQLGHLEDAQQSLLSAIAYAKHSSVNGYQVLAELYSNLGSVKSEIGDWSEAKRLLEQSLELFISENLTRGIGTALNNLADISLKFGYYRDAIDKLYQSLAVKKKESPQRGFITQRTLMQCFLALGRYEKAIQLGLESVQGFAESQANNQVARTKRYLATAYATLAQQLMLTHPDKAATLFCTAHQTLTEAETFFKDNQMLSMVAATTLHRAQIMLIEENYEGAYTTGVAANALFQAIGTHELQISALLLQAQALSEMGKDLPLALQLAHTARRMAHKQNALLVRQRIHYVLGKIHEVRQNLYHARKYYGLSAAIVERLQQDLSFTLVPGALQHQDIALRALARLYFQDNDPYKAFVTVERIKGLAGLRFLRNRESQRWNLHDPVVQALVDKFDNLRAEYFERSPYLDLPWHESSNGQQNDPDPDLASLEQELQAIQDQLFLHTKLPTNLLAAPPTLSEIQCVLSVDELVLEYFVHEKNVYVLTIGSENVQAHDLGKILPSVAKQLDLFNNILTHITGLPENHPIAYGLIHANHKVFYTLYQSLIAPLAGCLDGKQRLYVIPFGLLHNIPFNILFDGNYYLIQKYQQVVLPNAAFLQQQPIVAPKGVLALQFAHPDDLTAASEECDFVAALFDGISIKGKDSSFDKLFTPSCQILHLAMHARHIFDQPEFSYIIFADRKVMADDILQLDLAYELVTMSACQTGIVRALGGDEPIGLGRGFLYAGAGAIVSSLWAVNDETTFRLMKQFYEFLYQGYSKSEALQKAQCELLQHDRRWVHPAFWGAFQLIGDPRPLSMHLK